jgi:hypothetical protein
VKERSELSGRGNDHLPVEVGRRDGSDGGGYEAEGGDGRAREVFDDVVEKLGWDAFGEGGGGRVGFGEGAARQSSAWRS